MNREQWLTQQAGEIAPLLQAAGKTLPQYRITCGWPHGRKPGAWQVWPASLSADGTVEIMISPAVADSGAVFAALAAALASAAGASLDQVGLDQTGAFSDDRWLQILDAAGEYPHAAISLAERPVQSTRMLKASCPQCGYTIRLTQKWAAQGLPACPVDKAELALAAPKGE